MPLRGSGGVYPVAGVPRLAVGAGAVWAINPDGSVARIDPESGRLVATIEEKFRAWTIAAGEEGVWYLREEGPLGEEGPPAVTRIDPRTNRVARTIRVGNDATDGVAVGAGSVWVLETEPGLLWRIEPGPAADQEDDRRRASGRASWPSATGRRGLATTWTAQSPG